MIIRELNATVPPQAQAEYEELLREHTIPLMRAEPGLLYLHVGTPMPETPDQYVIVSVWDDLDSLKDYTGGAWEEHDLLPGLGRLVQSASVRLYDALPF
jgi:heme-degrading monooxygenase HmoA